MLMALCVLHDLRVVHLLLTLLLIGAAGCANKTDPEERERWTEKDWQQALRENEQRLRVEDEREAARFAAFEKVRRELVEGVINIYNVITGNTPFNAAKAILDPASADRRRVGLIYLAERDYGRDEPYTTYYGEMARTDPDHLVRAMAIRALNRSRDTDAIPIYLQSLEDRQPLVRLEAAKALANVPNDESVPALIRHLADPEETIDVRVAAADALRNHRTAPVAQALVRALRDRSFGVSWQARKSLRLMTGQDCRYDTAAWLTYLTTGQPFG